MKLRIKMKWRSRYSSSISFSLLYFLLQFIKGWGGKELSQGDLKRITQFFDRHGARILAFAVQNAFDGRLRNSR